MCAALIACAASGHAQGMDHSAVHGAPANASAPAGQAAFAVISDVVKRLKADPATDWSKVNIEALRQHLIDMDDVLMRSAVRSANVAGGVQLDITGTGRVAAAIKRMGAMHAHALSEEGAYVAKAVDIANGVRFTVTAKDSADDKAVARVRGLGFAGLFAEGDHHAMHHMEIARGGVMMHHK